MTARSARFEELRELIPHKDKLDKAAFLRKTIDYIGHMQVLTACPAEALSDCPGYVHAARTYRNWLGDKVDFSRPGAIEFWMQLSYAFE